MDRFIFIGDSLTFGYGVPKSSSWVYKFHKNYPNYEIINKGINGDTCTSILDRFYDDVVTLKPSKVFIMAGTNDLLSHRTITSIGENIELMIKDALSNDIKVILGAPPKILPDMAKRLFMPSPFYNYCASHLPLLRSELLNLSKKYDVNFVDFYEISLSSQEDMFIDGIHFNEKGHEVFYKEFTEHI
ncbi:MAG: GDSL-type esterase/lipase family protein [Clostridium sp.]